MECHPLPLHRLLPLLQVSTSTSTRSRNTTTTTTSSSKNNYDNNDNDDVDDNKIYINQRSRCFTKELTVYTIKNYH